MLNSHQGGMENLADPEKFCLLLSKLPSYQVQLSGMLLMEEKAALMQTLRPNIEMLKKICHDLMANKDLKNFLALTLQVGNYMNCVRTASLHWVSMEGICRSCHGNVHLTVYPYSRCND